MALQAFRGNRKEGVYIYRYIYRPNCGNPQIFAVTPKHKPLNHPQQWQ